MKIISQNNIVSFNVLYITDYIDKSDVINDMSSIYTTDIYVDDVEYFNLFKEITLDEFYGVIDSIKEKIKQI